MTIEMSSFAALLITPLLVFLSYGSTGCKAKDAPNCPGLCGIHNISHPFRLKGSPDNCGDPRYSLSCENNQLVLYLESGRYYVKSINYNNCTIRLGHASIGLHDFSSFPRYSLTPNNFSYKDAYHIYQDQRSFSGFRENRLAKLMLFLSCPYPVASSNLYIEDAATCTNVSYALGSTLYVNVNANSLWDLGLVDSCRVQLMYMTSWPAAEYNRTNVSCTHIHNMLLYGFELSWLDGFCKDPRYFGRLDDQNNPQCYRRELSIGEMIAYVLKLILALYLAAKFILGAPCVIILFIYKWRRRHLSTYGTIEDFLQSDYNIMPIRYSYRDIKKITGGFKIKLGNGGFGSVFRGQLRSGRLVAVKLLDKAKANGQDFINEVATVGRIHHVNVVQLVGFCVEGSKRALIYEFMPNGSLEKYIFSHEESSSLSCEKLYTISLGVARGIEYLHNGCNTKILHFDIKPHNILLDEDFNPKVSDFGLAKLYPTDNSIVSLTAAKGTIGYMAPELYYRNVGRISYKADVYSFGKLLMEMACRRENKLKNSLAENSSQIYFPLWVYDQLQEGKEITIENDKDEEIKLAKKMMIVALWCIQTRPSDRPSMDKVLEMLVEDEELQMPPKPDLYPQDDLPAEDVRDHSSSRPSSDISVTDSKESI